jgi:hypothetical protein
MNPAEVRNAFCAPVEGCSEPGIRVKCIPCHRGGWGFSEPGGRAKSIPRLQRRVGMNKVVEG